MKDLWVPELSNSNVRRFGNHINSKDFDRSLRPFQFHPEQAQDFGPNWGAKRERTEVQGLIGDIDQAVKSGFVDDEPAVQTLQQVDEQG